MAVGQKRRPLKSTSPSCLILNLCLGGLSAGTSGGTFLGAMSLNQTCYSSTADILPSQISLGAFPLTNSPNCTVDRDSRQLSQLRYPQQQQGVNESSEKTAFEPVSSFGNISLDPQSEERRQRQSHGGRSVQWPQLTEHFSVLGKFYFSTKVFPVFTTLRGNIVEVPFTAEELNERGSLPIEVNHYLWWYLDGLHCRPSSRRPLKRNAGTARSFKCFAHQSGKVSFQIMEEKNQASTLLPRVLAFDSVLKVYDEDGHQEHGRSRQVTRAQSETYHRLADRGIFAGLQHYMHCGDGKCYFDRTESRADADVQDPEFRQFTTIAKARCLCIHICRINTVFNYISRLQLLFSTTITMNMDRFVVKFGHLYDVRCKLVSYIQDWRFPWERIAIKSVCCTSKPTDFSSIELERALSDHFVQADSHLVYPRSLVATIANRWLKHMDPYVHTRDQHWGKKRGHLESALEVISPYKDSLKHAKTGKKLRVPDEGWPASRLHYLETNDRQPEGYGVNFESYHSEPILGKTCDQAISTEQKWSISTFGYRKIPM